MTANPLHKVTVGAAVCFFYHATTDLHDWLEADHKPFDWRIGFTRWSLGAINGALGGMTIAFADGVNTLQAVLIALAVGWLLHAGYDMKKWLETPEKPFDWRLGLSRWVMGAASGALGGLTISATDIGG